MVDDEQPIELNDLPDKGSVQENGQYMSAILLVGIQDWYNKINCNNNGVVVMENVEPVICLCTVQ